MRDTRKFNLTIGNSTLTRKTKRELAYNVFADASPALWFAGDAMKIAGVFYGL